MAKFFDHITDGIHKFIEQQHLFFVASAPLSAEAHVNVSPKGHDCFRILSNTRVAYVDLTGSGNETSAHLYENGRITLMWCAFDGPPNIVRLFGQGHTVLPGDAEWDELSGLFPNYLSARQIIVADIHKTMTSCGYAVPFYDYVGERDTDQRWAEAKGEDGLIEYRREKNVQSIDCLVTPLASKLIDAEGAD